MAMETAAVRVMEEAVEVAAGMTGRSLKGGAYYRAKCLAMSLHALISRRDPAVGGTGEVGAGAVGAGAITEAAATGATRTGTIAGRLTVCITTTTATMAGAT